MSSVLQPWLSSIPIRMQSTLLLGLRGDDSQHNPDIKKITRWIRGLVFVPGNPENVMEFMTSADDLPKIVEGEPVYKALDYCTVHYLSHLMHSLEVIAYCHNVVRVRTKALILYSYMCEKLHVRRELIEDFEERLKDLEWPGGKQPQNFEEALKIVAKECIATSNGTCDDVMMCHLLKRCRYAATMD